ncbi:hypothetical protein LCR01_05470 [Companilactobacillus crustorum]|uniref:Uncharacterized protein n=1 Tax=Companilactobacillus crustorum TaxID=392416 RepID=A0AB34A9U8_9LACO|nr:hypothetical protein LCR01_05470 [Companilactobacillus crustorum]
MPATSIIKVFRFKGVVITRLSPCPTSTKLTDPKSGNLFIATHPIKISMYIHKYLFLKVLVSTYNRTIIIKIITQKLGICPVTKIKFLAWAILSNSPYIQPKKLLGIFHKGQPTVKLDIMVKGRIRYVNIGTNIRFINNVNQLN